MKSENNLLPPFVIASLYKDELVIIDTPTNSKKVELIKERAAQTINFLGNNQKKITILLSDPTAVHVADESLQFLTSILAACKLNMGDVAIVNMANQTCVYKQIKAALTPTTLILFNITAAAIALPFEVPLYQVQAYDNCTLLFATPLETMLVKDENAKTEKGKLWNALKKIFNI
jgi:hypothetical protein